jgi:hypothetical protein
MGENQQRVQVMNQFKEKSSENFWGRVLTVAKSLSQLKKWLKNHGIRAH